MSRRARQIVERRHQALLPRMPHARKWMTMIEIPDKSALQSFREFLAAHGYAEQGLIERLGTALPPRRDNLQRLMHLTRELTAANALVRLFLLGRSLGATAARDVLPADPLDFALDTGLLIEEDDRIHSRVVIVPVAELLFASDAFRLLGSESAAAFVPPASTHAARTLHRLTMRTPVTTALDLGCGSGVHALFASRHADAVVATDVSPAALRYTEFNARLNGIDNVECREGSLFKPVAGESFDLIVSNPPFVIGPDEAYIYRDNPLELDEFCRLLLGEAPQHLNDGGHLQLLCEAVELEAEPWPERVRSWVRDSGCDAWILHSPPLHPVHYVTRRAADLAGDQIEAVVEFDAWVDYLESHRVNAVHPAMLVLRKRGGRNWLHVHDLAAEIEQDAGDDVRRGIAACDFLDRCSDDETLLDRTLTIAPELTLEQRFDRVDGSWQPKSSLLRLASALAMDAEVDMPIMAFLNQVDGSKSLRRTLEEFSAAVGADATRLAADLLPVVRVFIGRGFLLPAE